MVPLELPEDKTLTTPASAEDPARGGVKRGLAVEITSNGANVPIHFLLTVGREKYGQTGVRTRDHLNLGGGATTVPPSR
jgi:hypothetical protein